MVSQGGMINHFLASIVVYLTTACLFTMAVYNAAVDWWTGPVDWHFFLH